MSMAFRAIFSNFFAEQCTQNHPKYFSGFVACNVACLFPTTFLGIAVYTGSDSKGIRKENCKNDLSLIDELIRAWT